MQENPDSSQAAALLKDQDSDVLAGYYAVKRILDFFAVMTGTLQST